MKIKKQRSEAEEHVNEKDIDMPVQSKVALRKLMNEGKNEDRSKVSRYEKGE